jgi:hypothetical protein
MTGCGVFGMEKYYCDRCRLLYEDIKVCDVCGVLAEKKILIEVQNQVTNKKKT